MQFVFIVNLMLLATPAELTALRERRDAEGKRADLLWREGKYAEAVKVREALKAELETKLKDVPKKEQEGAYLHTSVDVEKNTLAEWKPLAALGNDAQSVAKLIIGLLNPKHVAFDGYRPVFTDAQVVKLLALVRKDAAAARLLGRALKLNVTGDEAAPYASELRRALEALGMKSGAEPFEVKLKKKGPFSAHLIGDDVDECALSAVASWPGRLDVSAHGFGDETTVGDCLKQRVTESVRLLAEQILRTAVRLPLADNPTKAEGL